MSSFIRLRALSALAIAIAMGASLRPAAAASYTGGAGGTIPDNNTTGVTTTITVPSGVTVAASNPNVQITLTGLTHSYIGDLVFILTAPDNTAVTFFNRAGNSGNASKFNGAYTFVDGGPNYPAGNSVWAPGSYKTAASFNTAFAGKNATGSWKLTCKDLAGSDVGSFTGWSFSFNTTVTNPSVNAVAVSPNPMAGVGSTSTLTVTLSAAAPTGGATVTIAKPAIVTGGTSVTIAAGQTTGTLTLTAASVGSGTITATGGTGTTGNNVNTTVTVNPSVATVAVAPNPINGLGTTATLTVTLSAAAPTGGATIAITKPAIVTGGTSVTIAAGQTSGTLTLTSASAGTGTITATGGTGTAGNAVNASVTVAVGGNLVDLTVDNLQATTTDTWSTSTAGTGYVGSNYYYINNQGTKSLKFTPNLPEAGKYVVYLKHMGGEGRTSLGQNNVTTVNTANGPVVLSYIDETDYAGKWLCLGAYDFNAGTAGNVVFQCTAPGGPMTIDAVRFYKPAAVAQDPVINAGIPAWRTPDVHGQRCADCHGMHGFDLAVFNFDGDGDIVRRALNHVNATNANLVRDMILALRTKYNVTTLDKFTARPFQPGNGGLPGTNAVPLSGTTVQQRDHQFGDQLASLGIDLVDTFIDTQAKAVTAKDQLLALNVWDIQHPIRLNRYSEDKFDGDSHMIMAEWVPMMARSPIAGKEIEWFALQDAYNIAPENETMFRIMQSMETMTEVPAASLEDPSQATGRAALFSKLQLQSLLFLQHFDLMRVTGQLGTFFDKNKAIQNQYFAMSGRNYNFATQLPGPSQMWVAGNTQRQGIGQTTGGNQTVADFANLTGGWRLPQREVTDKLTPNLLSYEHIAKVRLPWFHLGWLFDQAGMSLEANASGFQFEYYFNFFVDDDSPTATPNNFYYDFQIFVATRATLLRRFDSNVVRIDVPMQWDKNPSDYQNLTDVLPQYPGRQLFENQAHLDQYKAMAGNFYRMTLFLMEKDLDAGTYVGSGSDGRTRCDRAEGDAANWDANYSTVLLPLIARVRSKLAIYSPP